MSCDVLSKKFRSLFFFFWFSLLTLLRWLQWPARSFFIVVNCNSLFFLSANLVRSLKLLSSRCFGLLRFEPRFFFPEVCQWVVLKPIVSFSNAKAVVTLTLFVYFFGKWGGLQACFGFGVNFFFDNFRLTI